MMMPHVHLWNPLRAFQALQAQLEAASGSPTTSLPAVALYRRDDRVLLQALVPGLTAEAIRLEIDGDVLTLAGEWPEPAVEGARAEHVERPRGPFERRLRLPFEIDAAQVEARLADGVLEVELVPAPHTRPQRIEVRPENARRK